MARLMSSSRILLSIVCLALITIVAADVYLHSPRGSNDRLDEANRERDNDDRLFDSQNNNRGGYNVGNVYYYTGSIVTFEWSSQHSCGDATRANCELIIQYTCDDRLRDGTTTTTIPANNNQCYNYDCDSDLRFGRHESFASFQSCGQTMRNRGLFTGSQNLNGNSQRFTRQNSGGTRHGYECSEERDYYPYWQPTVWRDIAVLTNDATRCPAYQAASQNVMAKSKCVLPAAMMTARLAAQSQAFIPNNAAACAALTYTDPTTKVVTNGVWTTTAAWGTAAPDCRENEWSRDNHHGNVAGSGGFMASYNWTVPTSLVNERCAVRLRYNISTGDLTSWASPTSVDAGVLGDSAANPSTTNPTPNRDPARDNIWLKYGLNFTDVQNSFKGKNGEDTAGLVNTREYVSKNNPRVDMFGTLVGAVGSNAQSTLKTQLAINTAQYGRTFQDRSHRFAIRARPASVASADAVIHNVQVRGKRGNIVQVYPAVEYDFTPNRLTVQQGDYVHFQWTGSNTNPQNNAGNGLDGTDRSNLVEQRSVTSGASSGNGYNDRGATTIPPTKGGWGMSYPGRIDDAVKFLGLSLIDQTYLATLESSLGMNIAGAQFGGHMSQFDDAGTYFDLGPRQLLQAGMYHFMSTRNNAFSNRSQKGLIVITPTAATTELVGSIGKMLVTAGGQQLNVPAGTLSSLQFVTVAAAPRNSADYVGLSAQTSDFVSAQFDASGVIPGQSMSVTVNYDNSILHVSTLMVATTPTSNDWTSVSGASTSGGRSNAAVTTPGVYAVSSVLNGGAIAGIVIGIVAFACIVAGVVYYVYKRNAGKSLAQTQSANAVLAVTLNQDPEVHISQIGMTNV